MYIVFTRQTDGRTDERTNGWTGREHYASRQASIKIFTYAIYDHTVLRDYTI